MLHINLVQYNSCLWFYCNCAYYAKSISHNSQINTPSIAWIALDVQWSHRIWMRVCGSILSAQFTLTISLRVCLHLLFCRRFFHIFCRALAAALLLRLIWYGICWWNGIQLVIYFNFINRVGASWTLQYCWHWLAFFVWIHFAPKFTWNRHQNKITNL